DTGAIGEQANEPEPDPGVAGPFPRQVAGEGDGLVRAVEPFAPLGKGGPSPVVPGFEPDRPLGAVEGLLRLAGVPELFGQEAVGQGVERVADDGPVEGGDGLVVLPSL